MTFLLHVPDPTAPAALELKGRMMPLSVLRVLTPDLDALRQQLDRKIASAPGLFQNFPVVLDFDELSDDAQASFDIARLDRLLRDRSLVPVGIRGASGVLAGIAAGVGFGVISSGNSSVRLRPRPICSFKRRCDRGSRSTPKGET
jgi:septum site-determining protein MinC